jgi:hypothetical protein
VRITRYLASTNVTGRRLQLASECGSAGCMLLSPALVLRLHLVLAPHDPDGVEARAAGVVRDGPLQQVVPPEAVEQQRVLGVVGGRGAILVRDALHPGRARRRPRAPQLVSCLSSRLQGDTMWNVVVSLAMSHAA